MSIEPTLVSYILRHVKSENKLVSSAMTDFMQSRNLFMIIKMRLDGLNLKYCNFIFIFLI